MIKKKVIILGAGVGGLSVGWMLARTNNYEVKVIESSSNIGGVCGTFEHKGFSLDYGPHKFYSVIPGIVDELKELMGEEFLSHKKSNSIFMFNSFLDYPISLIDIAFKMGFKNLVQCGINATSTIMGRKESGCYPETYETYLVNRFGRRLYELVFEPLADKVWGDPSTLSCDIASTRIPAKSFFEVAMKAIGIKKETELTDAKYFYYPSQGFGRITERMKEEIIKFGGEILTSARTVNLYSKKFNIEKVIIETNGGMKDLDCDLLISSIPIESLLTLLKTEEGFNWNDTLKTAKKLQYRTAFLAYIFLNKEIVTNHHWIFFPERDVIFSRIFEQKQMSKEMCPENQTVLCCDFTDNKGGKLDNQTDKQLINKCISDLEKVGLIKKCWVKRSLIKRLPNFYPRYDFYYKDRISELYTSLQKFSNLLLTGRIGFYNYNNCDHCIDMGRFIAENLELGRKPSQIWSDLEGRVANYKIVD